MVPGSSAVPRHGGIIEGCPSPGDLRSLSDVLFAAKRTLAALGGCGDLLQLLLGRSQQFGSLARALLGQQRIEANDQALAGEVRMSDFDQIGLIEERHLHLAASSQFLDLGGA
jgi:hypothetical protein